ncbi:hypothetical protein [Streptomyces geranii]|uniref:hypothetical protein n=1 Tax=Streptomyces geranii TaxID=2058923 RepID=UPI00130095E2|nr:hypothetical protein [Streptomyces geranii]
MQAWEVSLVVAGLGALGGIPSALLSEDKGFALPHKVDAPDNTKVIRPGFLGHIIVGAFAAFLSWTFYGPLTGNFIIGGPDSEPGKDDFGLTGTAVAGAIGVGIGGARWLANYVDKEILQKAAATAAGRQADQLAQNKIANADPSEALEIAMKLPVQGDQVRAADSHTITTIEGG